MDEPQELDEVSTLTSTPPQAPAAPLAASAEQQDADTFLATLLPADPNTRRRVVTALLRAVLADRKIT